MGCVQCKKKGSGKAQGEGCDGKLSLVPSTHYDPDPTQPAASFSCIPDFNNFHGSPTPAGTAFLGPGLYPSNTLHGRGGGITGQSH